MKKVPQTEITPINTKFPRHMFNLDFVDLKNSTHANLGNRYLLNIIDHFSKVLPRCFVPPNDVCSPGLFTSKVVTRTKLPKY
jgi:hypothetical protein